MPTALRIGPYRFYFYGSLGIGVVYRQMWGGLAIRLTPNTRYAGLSRQIPKSHFYSYDCGEPRHMRVDRESMSAKFWLDPIVSLAENHGYNRKELRDIEKIAIENLGSLGFAGVVAPAVVLLGVGSSPVPAVLAQATAARTGGSSRQFPMSRESGGFAK